MIAILGVIVRLRVEDFNGIWYYMNYAFSIAYAITIAKELVSPTLRMLRRDWEYLSYQ